MFGAIPRLWNALASLAGHVEALAGTIGAANGQLRRRLGMDAPADTPAIDHAGTPAPTEGPLTIGHAGNDPAVNGRGGRKRSARV